MPDSSAVASNNTDWEIKVTLRPRVFAPVSVLKCSPSNTYRADNVDDILGALYHFVDISTLIFVLKLQNEDILKCWLFFWRWTMKEKYYKLKTFTNEMMLSYNSTSAVSYLGVVIRHV